MHLKFAIQVKKTDKWLNLDFHDGTDVIYVDKFLEAYHFKSSTEAINFLNNHKLDKQKHCLHQLEVFASPRRWL